MFAGSCFHWRKDDSDICKYSLKPWTPKTLSSILSMLNKVFWYDFQDVTSWQSICMMSCNSSARIYHLTTTKFPAIPA